MEFGLSLTT